MWEEYNARPNQREPKNDYFIWLLLAGRGFGKSRSGAEFIRKRVESGKAKRIALIARSPHEAISVLIKGQSGLLSVCPPWYKPRFFPSFKEVIWPCKCCSDLKNRKFNYFCSECPRATYYSSYEPNQVRGPEFDTAWCDELAAWKYLKETWDNLIMATRLSDPRIVITTTPRPLQLLRDLLKSAENKERVKDLEGNDTDVLNVVITRGTTFDNAKNLSPSTVNKLKQDYDGTRIGRQEIYGELIGDVEGALWRKQDIDDNRIDLSKQPDRQELTYAAKKKIFIDNNITRIVIGVDPAMSSSEEANETGIIVAGSDDNGRGYILEDASEVLTPNGWAKKVAKLYYKYNADRVILEKNQGGQMVEENMALVDDTIPLEMVWASKGKRTRAEPISTLYERGRISHLGSEEEFRKLEDQMINWIPDQKASPDRLDAMVWALSYLMVKMLPIAGSFIIEPEQSTSQDKSGDEFFFNDDLSIWDDKEDFGSFWN